MDRIYSRKRLKIPKLKKFARLKISVCLVILGLFIFLVGFIISIYPIFEENCKSKAKSIAIDITSDEINSLMNNYDYDDLVYIQRDGER